MKAPAMPHPLLDPRRLALLHGLGLDTAWVPRDALDPAELAALLPAATGVPAQRRADPGHGARGADQPRGAELAPAHAPAPSPTPSPAASRAAPAAASAGRADPARPVAQGSPAPMSEQRLLQVRALDWEPLQALAHDCRACKLGSMRQRAVFGVGHPQARVMVVGEAPGAEEDRQGEPFVGAAGKLLDNMLRACGLSRAGEDPARTVYIANVIKCRPPGNRNPEPDEIAQCLPILQRQIELVRLRQRAWDWHGTPLVVSYHPAYLLRTPQDKAKAWADLCLAQDLLEGRGA
jgi:DNA polymerase